MNTIQIRKQLHHRIDNLPDDALEQIADFTTFIMAKKQMSPEYEDWTVHQWQEFALEQFFREEDEVDYSLADAREIYEKP